jgi:hypothetical protein
VKEKRPPAGAATAFALEDLGFETVGYINREPRRIAEALDARGLSGDHELADLFRNFGDILPNQLQRMTIAIAAIEKGGLL